jgi:hypothetical protein
LSEGKLIAAIPGSPYRDKESLQEEVLRMENRNVCPSCGGTTVVRSTKKIDRRTGKSVKGLSLIGGIAFSAFGIGLVWLGVSLMTTPMPEGSTSSPFYYLGLAGIALIGGIRMIVGFLRADRVKEFTYTCIDCDHRWHGWESGAGVTEEDVREWRVRALKSGDPNARRQAIKAWGMDRDAGAVEHLIDALQASGFTNANIRADAAEALGKIGDSDAVAPLVGALEDKQRFVRAAAVKALAEIGGAKAKDALTQALEHKNEDVASAAEESLEDIRQREAQPD